MPQNDWWRNVIEQKLRDAHGYKVRQSSFFQSSQLLQSSDIQLLKHQCEQERTQIFAVLMHSLENPRLAGYMQTGKRSMFLVTDRNLPWLYHCPLVHSPIHTTNQCYDRIPIVYEGQFQFVDPITRQTHPATNVQNCTNRIKHFFQFDMDQEHTWYTLTPGIVHKTDVLCLDLKKSHQLQFIPFVDPKLQRCLLEAS